VANPHLSRADQEPQGKARIEDRFILRTKLRQLQADLSSVIARWLSRRSRAIDGADAVWGIIVS
jgi:hypothetical protein